MKRLFLLLGLLVFFSSIDFAQKQPNCNRSTNFLIDVEKPNVYLTFEQFGKATDWKQSKLGKWSDRSSIQKGNDVWLRLHNNSCWDIKLKTDSFYISKAIVDGKNKILLGILEDNAIANVQYHVEEQNRKQVPFGSHTSNISSLPSGKSILFGVLKEHLSDKRSIYVYFNYDWEVKSFSNNLAPEHRAFFWGYRLEEEK